MSLRRKTPSLSGPGGRVDVESARKRGTKITARSGLRRRARGTDWRKQLDALCRKATFARDDHTCVRCGAFDRIQWSHVRSRRYLSTRWAMFNVKTLCSGCHLWWGQNPIMAADWFRRKFPDRYQKITLADHSQHGKIDREAIRLELEQIIASHEEGSA